MKKVDAFGLLPCFTILFDFQNFVTKQKKGLSHLVRPKKTKNEKMSPIKQKLINETKYG